jgi:hypothetical protein
VNPTHQCTRRVLLKKKPAPAPTFIYTALTRLRHKGTGLAYRILAGQSAGIVATQPSAFNTVAGERPRPSIRCSTAARTRNASFAENNTRPACKMPVGLTATTSRVPSSSTSRARDSARYRARTDPLVLVRLTLVLVVAPASGRSASTRPRASPSSTCARDHLRQRDARLSALKSQPPAPLETGRFSAVLNAQMQECPSPNLRRGPHAP